MIVVTGGAGFIGSCVVRTLNDAGMEEILIVDDIASTDKWLNMRNKRYLSYVHKSEFLDRLLKGEYQGITNIIHLGACSSTTERNFDYLWKNNVEYSKALWNFCAEKRISFLYASSAATYGDGSQGFDDKRKIDTLHPLNGYGYSKQAFDLWTKRQREFPPQHAGLKFFNVYGPNEYCKGSMASMVFHGFRQIRENGSVKLFKSCNPKYRDGEQLRDFVYVKDVCSVILWLVRHPAVSGLFNVGTGKAQSFRQLAEATFHSMNLVPNIVYIDMPENLKEKYQYYTQAEMSKLREAGCPVKFRGLEEGAADYVQGYLADDYLIY